MGAAEGGAIPPPPPGYSGEFRTDVDARHAYGDAAGIVRIVPQAVAVPTDGESVRLLVGWAAEHGIPLTPRGSGTSMAGASVGAGLVVDLGRLDGIGPVDVANRRIRCGPGALCGAVDRAAREHGLSFPVDPSSAPFCTIGGMAGTNAAGPTAPRHGQMRDWVTALDCVFADGSRAWISRGSQQPASGIVQRFMVETAPRIHDEELREPAVHPGVLKEASGYATSRFARSGDVVDLLVGSEGTLAVFVGMELALTPAATSTASVLGYFATLEQAVIAASAARAVGASACELLDRTYLEVAGRMPGGGIRPEAMLLARVQGEAPEDVRETAQAVVLCFTDAGAEDARLAVDPDEERSMWEVRHAVSPALARIDPSVRSMQIIEDAAVPPGALPDFVRGVRALGQACNTTVVIFGHAADGNVHVNPLIDVRRDDWREVVELFGEELSRLACSLGGTTSGEHGDGRLRSRWLERCWGKAIVERFGAVKEAFDPAGILNPGVKLPSADAPPWTNRHDPQLPPLSAAAARTLAAVERERSYDLPRLALLGQVEGHSAYRGAGDLNGIPGSG
jgi:FAD/FMN-containing dehydrogenase